MSKLIDNMKKHSQRYIIIALLILMIMGAALRLIHIGVPSMWVDEANTVFSAESVLKTGKPVMPTGGVYGRAPLYTNSVVLMYRMLGASLENARATSAIFGILSIPLIYVIATLLFGWRTGLLSAVFITFSFYEIGWSRVARMYTQFQFFNLLSVLFFILGFERKILSTAYRKKVSGNSIQFQLFKGLDVIALIIFMLIAGMAYFSVHKLTVFMIVSLIVYIYARSFERILSDSGRSRWLNIYSLISIVIFIGVICVLLTMPSFLQLILKFLNYTPAWAQSGSSVSNPWVLFQFLFSWYRFPLGLLFVWGSIQVFIRKNKLSWLILFQLIVPLFFLSFVFTHRHIKYLFGAYPFFLMLAAHGLICLVQVEQILFLKKIKLSKKNLQRGIVVLIALAFAASPWLRIAKNIPWLEDGKPNGAVFFNEWKEASDLLHREIQSGDLIISSLPEVLLYYRIESDWALNGSNLALSSRRAILDKQGRFMEVYAGRPLIESLSRLVDLVNTHPRGWILLTEHHFSQPFLTPLEIQDYLETRMDPPQYTKNHTIRIYQWDHILEAENAF